MTGELARAWDEAAPGYERYFVPRFAPWVTTAVRALAGVQLPPGPILVPCCGTFPELPELVAAQPDREIVGIDLSAGMVTLAQERAAGSAQVTVIEGDAANLGERWSGACAAIVSVFGLQQLPDPQAALANWTAALLPGGRLSVMFWPGQSEQDGPFALLYQILARYRTPSDVSWEQELNAAVTDAGARVEIDERRAYLMTHPDAETIWEAMADSGPLRAVANARGDEFMRTVREEFLSAAPAAESGPWQHEPAARWIVAHRE